MPLLPAKSVGGLQQPDIVSEADGSPLSAPVSSQSVQGQSDLGKFGGSLEAVRPFQRADGQIVEEKDAGSDGRPVGLWRDSDGDELTVGEGEEESFLGAVQAAGKTAERVHVVRDQGTLLKVPDSERDDFIRARRKVVPSDYEALSQTGETELGAAARGFFSPEGYAEEARAAAQSAGRTVRRIPRATSEGYDLQSNLLRAAEAAITGADISGLIKEADEIGKRQASTDEGVGPVGQAVLGAVRLGAGQWAKNVQDGLLTAAGVGLAAGAVSGPAAVPAAKFGFRGRLAYNSYMMAVGDIYMDGIRDGLDKNAARVAALVGAVPYGALEYVQMMTAAKAFGRVGKAFSGVRQGVPKKGVARLVLASLGRAGAESVWQAMQEGGQEAVKALANASGAYFDGNVELAAKVYGKTGDEFRREFTETLPTFIVMQLVPGLAGIAGSAVSGKKGAKATPPPLPPSATTPTGPKQAEPMPPAPPAKPITVSDTAPEGIGQLQWDHAPAAVRANLVAMLNSGVEVEKVDRTLIRWIARQPSLTRQTPQEAPPGQPAPVPAQPPAAPPAPPSAEERAKQAMKPAEVNAVIEGSDPEHPAFDAEAFARRTIDAALSEAQEAPDAVQKRGAEAVGPQPGGAEGAGGPGEGTALGPGVPGPAAAVAGERGAEAEERITLESDRKGNKKPTTHRTWQEFDDWLSAKSDNEILNSLYEQAKHGQEVAKALADFGTTGMSDRADRWTRIAFGSIYREALRRGLDVPRIPTMDEYIGAGERGAEEKPLGISRLPTRTSETAETREQKPWELAEEAVKPYIDGIPKMSTAQLKAEEKRLAAEINQYGHGGSKERDGGSQEYHETSAKFAAVTSEIRRRPSRPPELMTPAEYRASVPGDAPDRARVDQMDYVREATKKHKPVHAEAFGLLSDPPANYVRVGDVYAYRKPAPSSGVPPTAPAAGVTPVSTPEAQEPPISGEKPAEKPRRSPRRKSDLLNKPPPGGWTDADKVRTPVGANTDGLMIEKDARGARSYVRDGIRLTQPVRVIPGMGVGAGILDAETLYRTGRKDFLTPEEIAKFDAEKETEKPLAQSTPGPEEVTREQILSLSLVQLRNWMQDNKIKFKIADSYTSLARKAFEAVSVAKKQTVVDVIESSTLAAERFHKGDVVVFDDAGGVRGEGVVAREAGGRTVDERSRVWIDYRGVVNGIYAPNVILLRRQPEAAAPAEETQPVQRRWYRNELTGEVGQVVKTDDKRVYLTTDAGRVDMPHDTFRKRWKETTGPQTAAQPAVPPGQLSDADLEALLDKAEAAAKTPAATPSPAVEAPTAPAAPVVAPESAQEVNPDKRADELAGLIAEGDARTRGNIARTTKDFPAALVNLAERGLLKAEVFNAAENIGNGLPAVEIAGDRIKVSALKVGGTPAEIADAFTSHDPTRFPMQAVLLDRENQKAVATDGRRLLVLPAVVEGETRWVAQRTIQNATGKIKKNEGDVVEGAPVPWKAVVPKESALRPGIVLDVTALRPRLSVASRIDKATGGARAIADSHTRSTFTIKDGDRIVAQANPLYVLDAIESLVRSGAGIITLEAPDKIPAQGEDNSPFIIRGDNGGFAVIMPYRGNPWLGPTVTVNLRGTAAEKAEAAPSPKSKRLPKRATAAKSPIEAFPEPGDEQFAPSAFKVGDRVVIQRRGDNASRPITGHDRHGVVVADTSHVSKVTTIGVGPLRSEFKKSETYRVKTDQGAEYEHIGRDEIRAESGTAPEVVPDPVLDGNAINPAALLHRVEWNTTDAEKYRSQASRVRKQDKRSALTKTAEKHEADARAARAAFEEWGAKYPEEAAKYEPPRTASRLPVPASAAAPAAYGMRIVEQMHTKRGHNVYIVTLGGRVDTDRFAQMSANARALGGKWDRGWKPTNSPAGFMFNDRPSAEKFMEKMGGGQPAVAAQTAPEGEPPVADVWQQLVNEFPNRPEIANSAKNTPDNTLVAARDVVRKALGELMRSMAFHMEKPEYKKTADWLRWAFNGHMDEVVERTAKEAAEYAVEKAQRTTQDTVKAPEGVTLGDAYRNPDFGKNSSPWYWAEFAAVARNERTAVSGYGHTEKEAQANAIERMLEGAREAAIGAISGGKVRQFEERGFEFFWGTMTDAEQVDASGPAGGGAARRLIERGIGARKVAGTVPEKATPTAGRPLPDGWSREDIEELLRRVEDGQMIATAQDIGIPTIHMPELRDDGSGKVTHHGYGVFEKTTPEYTVGFAAGGAMNGTRGSNQSYTRLDVSNGRFPYDFEAVKATLRSYLGEPATAAEAPVDAESAKRAAADKIKAIMEKRGLRFSVELPRKRVPARSSDAIVGHRLSGEWVYHNIAPEDIETVQRDGLQAGTFTYKPGFSFRPGETWIAVRKGDLPEAKEHQYGKVVAIEPSWPSDAYGNSINTVPPERVVVVDRRGVVLRRLSPKGTMRLSAEQPTDDAAYSEIKPVLQQAWDAQAGKQDLLAFFTDMMKMLGPGTRPYLKRFYRETAVAPEAAAGESPAARTAAAIEDLISRGTTITKAKAAEIMARNYGGTMAEGKFNEKDMTDVIELAVNRHVVKSGNFNPSKAGAPTRIEAGTAIADLEALLRDLPTQTVRTGESEKMQQFSTPPPLAYLVNWVANVGPDDVALEPSAGIGGIASFAKAAGATVVANELSERRADLLRAAGVADTVYEYNAEHINAFLDAQIKQGVISRPTVVVMNPPFSNAANTAQKSALVGLKHVEEALALLPENGRLVAIIGKGFREDPQFYHNWLARIGRSNRILAIVDMSGEGYRKYGTNYDNRLLVIDKGGSTSKDSTVGGRVDTYAEALPLLEEVRNGRGKPSVERGGAGTPAGGAQAAGAVSDNRPGAGRTRPGRPGQRAGLPVPVEPGQGEPAGANAGEPGAGRGDSAGTQDAAARGVVGHDQGRGGIVVEAPLEKRVIGEGVFSEYSPSKVRIPGAQPHPASLVESTAMAAIPPPDPTYRPNIQAAVIRDGVLSEAQLEQIVYAGQAHERQLPSGVRQAHFNGDGTGVGKGRTASGIILDNWNNGRRKAVWISKNKGLMQDAQRDISAVFGAAGLPTDILLPTDKSFGAGILQAKEGVAFITYPGLAKNNPGIDQNTGKLRQSDTQSRMANLVKWLGKDFDGVIVLDEVHGAGNAYAIRGNRGLKQPSKQGLAVVDLQRLFPQARIEYASATGATALTNLSFADRLGLWGNGTAFPTKGDFFNRVQAMGLTGMEIVAQNLKAMGLYLARSISMKGPPGPDQARLTVESEQLVHKLTPDQVEVYNTLASAWQTVMASVESTMAQTGANGNGQARSAARSALFGAQQRFFNQVLVSMQMQTVFDHADARMKEGHAIIFQFVNTNEAIMDRALAKAAAEEDDIDLESLELSPKDMLLGYINNSYPITKYEPITDEDGNVRWEKVVDDKGNPVVDPDAVAARDDLLLRVQTLKVPQNALDMILDHFGAENVAEVTGRSNRIVYKEDKNGNIVRQKEARSEAKRQVETKEFMDDKRRVLAYSDAGGTGASYHASLMVKNQRRRYHYLIQPGWRADNAIQGLGRDHRTAEASAPFDLLCSTDLRGHQRFVSTIARRLSQAGALIHGERHASSGGLFKDSDNLENEYAEDAVDTLFHDMFHGTVPGYDFAETTKEMGYARLQPNAEGGEPTWVSTLIDQETGKLNEGDIPPVTQFLNRILLLPVDRQNGIFDAFMQRLEHRVEQAHHDGTFDPGLQTLKAESVRVVSDETVYEAPGSRAPTRLIEVDADEPVVARSWEEAQGWHKPTYVRNKTSGRIYAMTEASPIQETRGRLTDAVMLTGVTGPRRKERAYSVSTDGDYGKFVKLTKAQAEAHWNREYAAAPKTDTRRRTFVSGAFLPVWDRIAITAPKIWRVPVTGGDNFIGVEIPEDKVDQVRNRLEAGKKTQVPPEQVFRSILTTAHTYDLANGWRLKRSMVGGEPRIEVIGVEYHQIKEFEEHIGGYAEKRGYEHRFFLPTGADNGPETMARLLQKAPVTERVNDGTVRFSVEPTRASAAWTPERIGALLQEFGYGIEAQSGNTKAYAVWMSPDDFLGITNPNIAERMEIERQATRLDRAQLARETQPIILYGRIDESGTIFNTLSHEGRHRMVALSRAGASRVPVVLNVGFAEEAAPLENLYVSEQQWANRAYGMHGADVQNAIPVSYRYEDALRGEFGRKADIRFNSDGAPIEGGNRPSRLPSRESAATIGTSERLAKGDYHESDIESFIDGQADAGPSQQPLNEAHVAPDLADLNAQISLRTNDGLRSDYGGPQDGGGAAGTSAPVRGGGAGLEIDRAFESTPRFRAMQAMAARAGTRLVPVRGFHGRINAVTFRGQIWMSAQSRPAVIVHEIGHLAADAGKPAMRALLDAVDLGSPAGAVFRERIMGNPMYFLQMHANARAQLGLNATIDQITAHVDDQIRHEAMAHYLEGGEELTDAFTGDAEALRAAALQEIIGAEPATAANTTGMYARMSAESPPGPPSTGPPQKVTRRAPPRLSELTPKALAAERTARLLQGRREATQDIREALAGVRPAMRAARRSGVPIRASEALRGLAQDMDHRIRETEATLNKVASVVSLGEKATARDIRDAQGAMRKFISDHMPREELKRNEWRELEKDVIATQTAADIEKVAPKVVDLADRANRRILTTAIKGLWNKIRHDSRMAVDIVKEVMDLLEPHINEGKLVVRGPDAATRAKAARLRAEAAVDRAILGGAFRELKDSEISALRSLAVKPLSEMSTDELRELRDKMAGLQAMGRFVLKARRAVRRSRADAAAEAVAASLTPAADFALRRDVNGLSWTERARNRWHQKMGTWNWHKNNVSPADSIFMDMQGSRSPEGAVMQTFKRPVDVADGRWAVKFADLVTETREKVKELDIDPNRQELIGVHAIMQQETGEEKLINAGYDQAQLHSLPELTANETEFLNWMRGKMDALFPVLQRIARDYYNTDLKKEDFYFPFLTDWEYLQGRTFAEMFAEEGDQVVPIKAGASTAGRTTHTPQGFMQERVGAGRQPVQTNALRVFLTHMNHALYYAEMEPTLQDLNKVLANENLRKAMGPERMEFMRNWMDTVARHGGVASAYRWPELERLVSVVGAAKLAFKLPTALVQTTPIILGLPYNGAYQLRAAVQVPGSYSLRQWIYANSPEVRFRMGNDPAYDANAMQTILRSIVRSGFYPLVKIDRLAASITWFAAYNDFMAKAGKPVDISKPADPEGAYHADVIMRRVNASQHGKDMPPLLSRGSMAPRFRQRSIARAAFQFQNPLFFISDAVRRDVLEASQGLAFAVFVALTWLAANAWETAERRFLRRHMQPDTWKNRQKYAGATERLMREQLSNAGVDESRDWANLFMDYGQQTLGNIPGVMGLQGFSSEGRVGMPVVDTVHDVWSGTAGLFSYKPGERRQGAEKAARAAIGGLVPGGSAALQVKEMATGERDLWR